MSRLAIESDSDGATREIGRAFGEWLAPGARVGLTGPLGAGKTRFVQGVVAGLGCHAVARSPSYVLVQEYEGRCPIFHCDWYRLETDGDVESTGFADLLRDDAVVLVEWADKHPDWLPPPRVMVDIEFIDATRRRMEVRGEGLEAGTLEALARRLEAAGVRLG